MTSLFQGRNTVMKSVQFPEYMCIDDMKIANRCLALLVWAEKGKSKLLEIS